jgi:RHS repeat-associated protein
MIRGGKSYLVVTDEIGSPRLLLDTANGAVIDEVDMDPWGRIERETTPRSLPFGLAGGLTDPDTGLVHFGVRDYDPVTARWTAPDPAGPGGGDVNQYRYASGDPVNRIDPPGTCDVVAAGLSVSGFYGPGGSLSLGVVVGGTDLGVYGTLGKGVGTPGGGIAVEGTCLSEVGMKPGTSDPASPIDLFSGTGGTTDLAGIAGVGQDVSFRNDGSVSLAGGHGSFGI